MGSTSLNSIKKVNWKHLGKAKKSKTYWLLMGKWVLHCITYYNL